MRTCLLPVVFIAAIVAGCGTPKPQFIKKPYPNPRLIAVVPFANQTNDVRAPVFFQKLAIVALKRGGYEVVPPDVTERKLREAGITQGGQLGSKSPAEIARLMGADAVFYGTLKRASHLALGVYLKRRIDLAAELVDVRGERIWGHGAGAGSSEVFLDIDRAAEALAVQLAVKWVESMVSHPLYPEMRRGMYELLRTMPSGFSSKPVSSYIRDWRRTPRNSLAPKKNKRRRRGK